MLSNGFPEIVILRSVSVAQGNIADDTERDERNLVDIAGLGNGTRLHVDGLGFGEVTDNFAHLILGVYKPVTRDDESRMERDVCWLKADGFAEQKRVSVLAGGQALHMCVNRGVVDGF